MLCITHAKHDSEDKQGCPSCMRNKIAALRAECERLKAETMNIRYYPTASVQPAYDSGFATGYAKGLAERDARIEKLEAALTEIHELLSNYRHGTAKARAAAALKGDTSEIRRRASPDDKHPEDRIVH